MPNITSRHYIISYNTKPWEEGYWKNLLEAPHFKHEEIEYDLEFLQAEKNELKLHVIGKEQHLDRIEVELAKYGVGMIDEEKGIIVELRDMSSGGSSISPKKDLIEYCEDKGYNLMTI
jgi:hypothetical protein